MAEKAPEATENSGVAAATAPPPEDHEKASGVEHEDAIGNVSDESTTDLHKRAGIAVIRQQHTIPTTGKRLPTSKWEYIFFCVFYFSNNGARESIEPITSPLTIPEAIGGNGGALRQALLNLQFPDGKVDWGGQVIPINSYLLDVTGILFAAQLVVLLIIGPYADYGNWRPWILIIAQTILYICQFAMCGMSRPDQWQSAQVLYVIGSLAANVATAFYAATFPGLVRDLPELIQSEHDVAEGAKSPADHEKLDSYERSKLYNLVNITGSALVVVTYAVAVGISAAIGYQTDDEKIKSYRVLMGYFGIITVICTVPFFIVQKHRPGQQLPDGAKWWLVGPQQVWSAMKSASKLKQCLLYLLAYFMLQETFGTYFNVTGILQNEIINYSPLMLNAMSLTADLAGGSGTVFVLLLQKKFRFSVKAGVFYGACMTLIPSLWGGIGYFTNTIGFHHVWEFWLVQVWNFQTAAWGSYQVTMISEVVPAPKAYMFFALFNTVGKTSGFIGPFISSAIIDRADGRTNAAYWFLFAMGSVGAISLYFVDTDKAKEDIARYLEREADELYSEQQREQAKQVEMEELNEKL
ncbi:putative autophagy protein [Thozetella sp. PMI_491]|nr:putative autophagy protein [Thozetella sp. PMI_491]